MAVGAALAFAAANVPAQETTQADKDKALAYLESTEKGVLDATKGLSGAQWNFKAAPDKWSVAECVEHIAADRDTAKIDAGIMAMIPDRSQKAQAPDELKPTNRFGSPEGSLSIPYLFRHSAHRLEKSLRLCLAELRIRRFDPIAEASELSDHSGGAPGEESPFLRTSDEERFLTPQTPFGMMVRRVLCHV